MAGAQWVRIDVGYLRNPKVRRAGPGGALLHLASVCYLAGHELDDGLLPPEALPVIAAESWTRRLDPAVEALVKAGLWHPSMDGGMVVHDYETLNGTQSAAYRHRARERRRRGGET